ncbi:MAG: sigma-70 family RNA polymerase sigma factor [Bacteroidota bacterium]
MLRKKTGCNKEDAEDLFVEAVLILEQKHQEGKLQELDDLKTYLMGTCHICRKRSYFNEQKRKKAERDIEKYFYSYLEEMSFPIALERTGKEELLMAVEFSLRSMGEKCRQLINLFYYEQKNMKMIAQLLGFSDYRSATVSKFRCFKTLKEKAISLKIQFENQN